MYANRRVAHQPVDQPSSLNTPLTACNPEDDSRRLDIGASRRSPKQPALPYEQQYQEKDNHGCSSEHAIAKLRRCRHQAYELAQ